MGNQFGGLPNFASIYDPQIAVDQAALDRQMAIANALRQQALEPIPSNRSVGGMAYRTSPLELIGKLAQGYSAQQTDQVNDAQRLALALRMQGAYAPLFDPGSGPSMTQGDAQQTLAAPQPSANPLDTGSTAGPTVANQASAVPTGAPTRAPGLLANIPGLSPQESMQAFLLGGPDALIKARLAAGEPTPGMKEATFASGGNQANARQLMMAKALKGATMAGRPGGYLQNFATGQLTNLPQTQPGFVSVQDQSSPTGFRTVEQPGGLASISEAAGAKSGAEAQAKAPYEFEMVKMADGSVMPISKAQLASGGGKGLAAAVRSAPSPAAPTAPPSPTAPNPAPAAAPTSDPWASMPMLQPKGGIGQSTRSAELDKSSAELQTKMAAELSEKASAANDRIAMNNQSLEMLNQNPDTGFFANHLSDFRNIMASLGVKSAENQAATDQVLAKDLTNTALQKGRQLFGARFTQSEVGLMLSKASPSPEMQSTAIRFLLNADNAMNNYAIQKTNDFGTAMAKGGDPARFEGWYAKTFPASKAVEGMTLAGAKQPAPAAAASAPAGMTYVGTSGGRPVYKDANGQQFVDR